MSTFSSGWRVASLYDPENGDVAQINRIAVEHSDYANSTIGTEHPVGQKYGGQERTATVGFFESDQQLLDKLEDWTKDSTPLCLVVVGTQGNLLWYEPQPIEFLRDLATDARTGLVAHQFTISDVGNSKKIWHGVNLLTGFVMTQGFNYGWSDENPNENGVPSGWSGTGSHAFAGGELTFTGDIDIEGIFPIQGAEIRSKVTVVSGDPDGMKVELFNYDEASLESDTSNENPASVTTPAGSYKVVVSIETATEAVIKNPWLRVDKKDKYAPF